MYLRSTAGTRRFYRPLHLIQDAGGALLPDAKTGKDAAQQIVCAKDTGDFSQVRLRQTQLLGQQLRRGRALTKLTVRLLQMRADTRKRLQMPIPRHEQAFGVALPAYRLQQRLAQFGQAFARLGRQAHRDAAFGQRQRVLGLLDRVLCQQVELVPQMQDLRAR